MSIELAILGFLNERPRSGYDLKTRCFAGPVGHFWNADQAQIYRTLERLGALHLVTSKRRKQVGRPDRKVYEITHAGREALYDLLAGPIEPPLLRDPFLVQLFFAHHLDDEALLELLQTRRAHYQQRLDGLRAALMQLGEDKDRSDRDDVLRHTALEGAVVQTRAQLDWLDDCIRAVLEHALPGSDIGSGQRHLFSS